MTTTSQDPAQILVTGHPRPPKLEHHDDRHEPTMIAAARFQMTASSPRSTFSQAELTGEQVITRSITRSSVSSVSAEASFRWLGKSHGPPAGRHHRVSVGGARGAGGLDIPKPPSFIGLTWQELEQLDYLATLPSSKRVAIRDESSAALLQLGDPPLEHGHHVGPALVCLLVVQQRLDLGQVQHAQPGPQRSHAQLVVAPPGAPPQPRAQARSRPVRREPVPLLRDRRPGAEGSLAKRGWQAAGLARPLAPTAPP